MRTSRGRPPAADNPLPMHRRHSECTTVEHAVRPWCPRYVQGTYQRTTPAVEGEPQDRVQLRYILVTPVRTKRFKRRQSFYDYDYILTVGLQEDMRYTLHSERTSRVTNCDDEDCLTRRVLGSASSSSSVGDIGNA